MGNVCGCVRAEKEELCLDPAKAPLSPAKHSPGRKYLRRKRRKKPTEEGPDSVQVKENEEKSQYEVGISENIEIYPKGVRLADSVPGRVTVAGNALPVSTDVSADPVKAKISSGETKSDSLCGDIFRGDDFRGDNQRLTKSEEAETWLKEQEKCCAWKKKYLEDGNRRELAFLKKSSGLCYGKAASLDSAIHILGRQCEEIGLNVTSCRILEDVPETSISEKLHRFLSERKSDSLLEQKKFSSAAAVLSQLPKEKALFSIPPNRSKISDIHVTGESEDMSAKERLLLWSQQTTEGYAGIHCENFTTCWRDGRLFNAIIHKYRPDLIDMNTVAVQSNLANLEHAFFVAEKLGVARLLDPEDVDVSSPDEKSVITYVSSLYDAFPKVPEGGEGISANDVEVKWVEYQNMVNYLTQWIRHHVTIMSDRTFPNSPVELKALYNQYLQFKETEIPPKETDKSKIKRLYKLLEVWIEFGRIKLPQGYHPNDIEKEWGKLIIAMLEREKILRPEAERLDTLQQIANRIQRDSQSCEDKLILAKNALQSDIKRLESGLQFQCEAEVAGYLLESENLIRQQVIDGQILIDGKYYQANQLVQRISKLNDELVAIRTEYSSVYNKRHALTTEQTKLMISGITESLNSGFTTNLTPELNAAMTQGLAPTLTTSGLTSGLSSGLPSRLTPTITPTYTPGVPPWLIQSYVTGVDSGTLQTLKLMQIRKPLMKSAFAGQNLTEEEVNMKFVQDLLNWVEEMQMQLDRAEWGSDLPSVESHLENHKNVHKAIEEFESSLKEAKISEIQMTTHLKLSYTEKLHKLESQYSKLLNTSRNQERHLDTLHNFVSRATRELIWLNEKEEEEVAYDWSERNPNIIRKKEYHAELMRELNQKEVVIKSVQEIAEQLLLENHPARLTIEAYRAAMQTQWSWILQLCHCVEQHLRENAAYFEFFSDAKEAMEYLKNLKDTIHRKYSCDRSSSLHRLEDLVQESMEEKEQLLQYKSTVAGLVGRAKAIIQLEPRNPDCILKTSIPIKAICDYRQIEITIYKDDECVLANNSHRAKWKVISPSGNEAMVPSVCFTIPPPNKEAIDTANRIEQQFQNVLALWHESHVNMKSVVSWHYLTNEIEAVRAGTVALIKTMLPGEHQQVLSNLQSRFDDFVEDSRESKIFTNSDVALLEKEVDVCKQYYQDLLKSAEREEQEESIYNLYISEVRNIRLQLENCEERLIQQIRTPMERDDLHESVFRISEQEKLKKELDRLKDDLGVITDKCEEFFSQAAGSPSVPTLCSELSVVIQNMNQVYSMSSIYIDKLKSVNLVLSNTQAAESLVKLYETKLCEEEAVTADKNNIENLMGTLKQWRSEVDENRQVFHALEDELQKAKMISDQMFKMHKERDLDFDWHKEKVDQLAERWQNIHSQIENRLRDLEGINKSLKYYKDTYNSLDTWIQQVEDTQRKIQEIHPENSKALAKQLNQHKALVSEIEMKQSKIDKCQKYSEQYSAAVKDYELQTMTYRAMVDSQQKSPVKRRRMQSSSDFIIQEFMDLRTRYTALVTLMTQYIKFAGDSLKRLEEEESLPEEESELQQPVKSAEIFQHSGCNEAVEFRENTPYEIMMDVEYLQKDNSSSKPKHTENKLEMDRRKLDVDRCDKIKTDRTLKQFLNFSGQESSITSKKNNKLYTEEENVNVFHDQNKEKENSRKDCFVSAEVCVSSTNDPDEMLNEQIVSGERQKTEGVSKKFPEVEMIHKTIGKKKSRKAGSDTSAKEEREIQSDTDFQLTMKKDDVAPKTGTRALDISPYKQQHFSPRTHFDCQCKEHCCEESSSHNTLNSEDRGFQACREKGDSPSGVRDTITLETVASSFRELAVHNGSEKAKLDLRSVSDPGISGSVEWDISKMHRESLDESCFIAEKKILEKLNLNPNEARSSTMQEFLSVSSGNISENQCAATASESYLLDLEVPPVQSDPSLGTELLGNAGDVNASIVLSEIIYGGEDYFPLSENGLGKQLLTHNEKVNEKKLSRGKVYGLDTTNRSREKQSGEYKLEQGQKCKDLLLVAELDSRDKDYNTKVPGENNELQKTFCEKRGEKALPEKKEKQKKRGNTNEEKRSTAVIKILKSKEASELEAYSDLMAQQNSKIDENKKLMGKVKTLEELLEDTKKQKFQVEQELSKLREAAEKEKKQQRKDMEEICLQKTKAEQEAKQCHTDLESIEKELKKNIEKVFELTLFSEKANKTIKDLKYELHEMELQKSSTEEKSFLFKEELDKVNSELKCLKIKLEEKDQAERGYLEQLKEKDKQLHRSTRKAEEVMQEALGLKQIKMNYQEELKSVQKEKTQLKREVEELMKSRTKTEITIERLNFQISSLQKEKLAAEHRAESCQREANNRQDLSKKIQEQLLRNTKVEKENHQEIQMLKNELAESNEMSETLKKRIEDLNKWNTETKLLMKQIQSESEKVTSEKQRIQKENDALKALADGFKEQLRTTNEQLHKQTITEQEFMCKIKSLEDDLAKTKNLASEYKQKCDKQSASTLTADQEMKNLNAQIHALTMEKRASEQKMQLQQDHVQELSNKLKKLQDELHQKTLDEQMACKKMMLFQEESVKFKQSAEEYRKNVEKLLESHAIKEKNISGIELECIILHREKRMAEEIVMSYKTQVKDLQEMLKKCHEQLQQGKQAEKEHQQKCRQLEEELEVQKRLIASLKQKTDMQVKETEHRVVFQNEVQQNNELQVSGVKLSCERRRNNSSYLSDTATRECEQFSPHAKPSSPLLRQKQERSFFTSEQIEEETLCVSADDMVPREKSMEEEKKEHVEKAEDLLKWMSSLSKTLSKEEGEKTEKTDLPKQQISLDEMSTKKEQIAEALQTTQLFLSKHSDKMTEEEKNEMEKQVRSLQESYSLLTNETLKQLQEAQYLNDEKMEEKVNKVIAGVIDQTTGEVFSVFQSILKGFIDYDTGIRLLENQLILSGIISPELGVCYDLEEAKDHDLIDEQTLLQLQELSNAKKLISEPSLSNLPVVSALEQGLISEPLAVKILENQLASGHLILPSTGENLTLQNAFQRNLISPTLYTKLLERRDTSKDLLDPSCAEKISLEQMVHRSIIHEETGLRLLPVKPQEKGRITFKCGRKITILRAAHEGLIDRETMFRLLSSQLMSGGIIDPDSGKRMTVEEATRQGVIDQDTACGILTHQVQTGGILCPNSGQRLTVDEAVQCNLISSSSALLVLEAQRGFVGLIWPHTGEIFPISTSLHQEMITNELAFKILNDRQKIAALYIPETCEIVSLDKAAQSGIIDSNSVSVLTNVILPDKMPNVEELKFPCKNAAKWLSTYEFLPSVSHDCEEEHEDSSTEDPVCRNLDQAKKLFISYLMVNSYMDANTGRRLLLYDGQLQDAISTLLDSDGAADSANVSEKAFDNKYINPKGINLKLTGSVHFNNVPGSVQDDFSGAENTSKNKELNQFEDFGNCISLQGEDLHVHRPGVCNAVDTEQSEYTQEVLLTKPTDLRNVVSSTQDSTNRNALGGLPEVLEWTELRKHNCQKASSGNIEGYLPSDSNPSFISETEKEVIYMADSLGKENRKDKTVENSLSVEGLTDNETWKELERCTKYGPHILQTDNSSMELDNSKKNYFHRSSGSAISADTECRLPKELVSKCSDTLQFEDDKYGEQPLQNYTDVPVCGRPSSEDCPDWWSKLCLEGSGDTHCRPSLDGDTVIYEEPPVGYSNSTAQTLTAEENSLTFDKLLPCDSSSDTSVEGSDSIPQFESHCLQHECGEVASEGDSSQSDDDAYETPQSDDDGSDISDTSLIDEDDSYGTPQDDDGFDALQLRDDGTLEPELSGKSIPLGFLEERDDPITLRQDSSSFQELATNAGESIHVNLTGLPKSINTVSGSAESTEIIPEEERERIENFGENEQKLAVTLESKGRKEGGLSSLWMYKAEVQGRNEEEEMKAGSDSYEDESEGTQEEEDYEEDYGSYDDSDTDSDSDEEMDIFCSHHQCINKGDQLLISLGDKENSNESNENIADCSYSLGHKTGYTLRFQSNHENGKLSSGKCESASDVSEGECIGLACTNEEDRQQETEDEYVTCVKSKHMSQDTAGPIQAENTFDTKWMSCKSKENNKAQLKFPSSQLPGDTVTSDVSVTSFLITEQATDDESTQTNLLLSKCFVDSVNTNNSPNSMLHSNHGQRQRETEFAEEKLFNDVDAFEQLRESSSQIDNKFLTDMCYVSDGDSSLSSQVHPVTVGKHGQIRRDFDILTENRINMEECDIMGLSKSPIHMESLGEIFDASVIKADRETLVSNKEKVNAGQASFDSRGDVKSYEFKTDFNISASLKQYTIDIKEGSHSELNQTKSCCFEDGEKGKKDIQNEKAFLLNKEGGHSSDFNIYSFAPTDTLEPKEMRITEETGRGICQNTDNVLKDLSETMSSSDSHFSPVKVDVLGSIEDTEVSGDGSEMLPSGSHTHTTDDSSAVLSSIGDDLDYGAQREHEMLNNTKAEKLMASETSSLGNSFRKQMSVESLQKEMGHCKDFQVKESISQSPEMSDTLMEDLKNILQRKLKMGHVSCKQEGEPLSYSDTKTLMQNLLSMVRSTQLGSDTSSGSDLKQINNAVRTALMFTTPCAEPKDSDALSLLWPDGRSPDLLRDILKQESCKQKMADPNERKSETDLQAPVPKLSNSELLEIFQILPGDESTSKLEELISGLLTKSQIAGITTEHEGKGKAGGLCTLFSTEQLEFGSEIAKEETLADNKAVVWRSDQEPRKTDSLSRGFTETVFKAKEAVLEDTSTSMVDGMQQCLKLTEKMRGHLRVLQDMKSHLDNQQPISNNLEILKNELEQLESFESGLATFAIILKKDMRLTEEFLKFCHRDIPEEKLKELKISYDDLQEVFLVVCDTSSKRAKQIVCAVDSEMSKLAVSHQQLLSKLQRFSDWITEKSKIMNDFAVNSNDIEEIKKSLQLFKNDAADLSCKKVQLESTAFDVQFFISEHAQDLSPNQSKQLLRLLNTTQKSFQEVQEAISSRVESLETQLQAAQELGDQKDVAERQQECKEKLQEICDLLTQTENRLIGQQESLVIGDSKAELEQYQSKQEEIQKDMRMSAQRLAEIVKNTESFLKENGEKLSQEDKTILEQKLNEAKTKCLLLSQKAEESKKELDKAMTTAIKQETEKVAAIEQLEESKNTIENLLDWLSNVDKEAEHGRKFKQALEQNGTHFEEGDETTLDEEEDDVNGNLLEIEQDFESQVDGLAKSTDDNLNQQYQKVKAQHEKIISQQQAVIIATQSAQALLEKQGHYLSPEEKDKMQRNMKELKAQYETALAESERKMKLTHSLREELEKFDADYSEFETWLQQAEQELDNLEAGASDFSGIMIKLKRQKSFSEDVISHKGDLRYITISGQRVLDAARSCSKRDGVKVDKDGIDTSATYTEVQNKLDSASDRFKSLYTKCSILGNNLKDLVDKYQHYEDASSGLLSGLQASEIAVNKQLLEPIAVDPKNLQRQLEETKVLQGQVSNHQIAVEKLKKAAEVLLDTRGELTPDKNEIQKTLDDIVERYDNLSKSVNERNEKLQITLTRSLSVQDGLDEMMDWMEGVEKSLEEQDQVPLNSAAIQDIISKSIMLEQDIMGRQSSINTMNEKVKKFTETADPSTASTLKAKMSELAGRFSEASNKHKEKLRKMEELKTKVELFEGLSEKLQSFIDEKNQALSETEAPRKDVSEVSQYMQEASIELAQHKKDLEVLQQLLEELSVHALPGDKALVLEKVNALSKKFREVEETVKEKEEDVSSCQKQMDTFELLVESLKKWIKEMTERIPTAQPSLNTEELKKPLADTLNLKDEWTLKAPEIQKMNSRGTLLCNLITAVTSPAKLRAVAKSGGTMLNGEGGAPGTQDFLKNKELTTVQQAMSDVNHSYEDLGVLLKEKISELESMLSKMQNIQEESTSVMQWLQKMDKTASDWEAAPTDSEAVKAQVEQHKLFETELKQSANKVQELKDKVTELLEKNPDSSEAPKWRQMLDKIDSKWKELNQVTSERQQKLEESSNYLTQFQTAEAQLKHWLVEKELMVSVLGPLSIDPNMLNTQKQQVQILLKEFDTRKPQYEQLTMAGEGILKRPGEHPPSHEIVKEQLAAVAQKWDSLTGQLRNRCDRIDQAIVKSTEYQSLLRSLSDKLSALDSKLSSSLAVSTQPDAVKQQLEIAREMKEEIEQEMKNINAAQALCEELSALVGEEYLKAELTRQLDGILKSFKDIEQKSDNHVQQLQLAYATSHQFQQMSKDFQAWLGKKKEELNQARPVSAKLDTLQSLIEEQKDFKKTMSDQISSYERIVAEGESILQKTQGADKAALQSQIATLRSNWDEMNKQVKERQDKLTDCLEKALQYRQHVENLQPWIEKCQGNLCELKVGINPVEIENSIVQVRAWQKDLDKHHGMVELLNNTAESLLSASQTDKEVVQEETKVLNQKVNVVTEQLHKKRECLENMAQRLKEFQESSREIEKQLKSAKEHLETHDSLGPQSFSNKHLTMMQTQQKALQALKPHVDLAKKLAQDMVVEASDSAGVSDLLLQAESLEREYTAVNQQVEDRCSFLETKLQGIGHFQNSIREMFSQFAEFDDELDSMAPVGRDLKVLRSQREDIKHFLKKLEDLIMNNENANKSCKILLTTEAEASPDLVGIKRDLEALNKQCNKLLDRAKAREDQVEGTISRVEEFYSKLKDFSTLLGRAEEHEESQGPVGMETETINQQLNTFKIQNLLSVNENLPWSSSESRTKTYASQRTPGRI